MKEKNFIWLVESASTSGEWYQLILTSSICRDEARERAKELKSTFGGEYRVRKYVRTEDKT